MRFVFTTTYDSKALTAMAKCIRKTTRKKRERRSHVIGCAIVVIALLRVIAAIAEGNVLTFPNILMLLAAAAIIVTFIFEDRFNAAISAKGMLKGSEKSVAVFDTEVPDTFISETEVGKTEFPYCKLEAIAETEDCFVFALSDKYAQVYDKHGLDGGSADEFREFIAERTGKTVIKVK
nr:YcxB family protein [Clostridia bacterium]